MKVKYLALLASLICSYAFADTANVQKVVLDPKPCQLGDLDPSPSSPPNNIDDPGTTDPGCFEINHTFNTDHATNPDGSKGIYNDYALDMNYGIKDGLQGKVVIHYNTADDPTTNSSAMGRIEVGAKQRIYENEEKGLNIALFPTIDFMTPGSSAIEKGLPDSGTNLTIPILISKKYGPVVFLNNAGVVMSLSDPQKPAQIILSTAAGINISKDTILTGEIYRTSATNLRDNATTSVGVGMSTKLSENALLYMSVGESIGDTADGASHVYALAGIKVLFGKGSHDKKEFRFNFNNPNDEDY